MWRLHAPSRFLVSYTYDHNVDYNLEHRIFRNDCSDNGQTTEVIRNDSICLDGRPSLSLYDASIIDGLLLREKLKQSIYDHDLHCPRSHSYNQYMTHQ